MNESVEEYIESRWRPVSVFCLWTWIILGMLFILHAITDKDRFLLMDYINLPFHEAGHIMFGIFGKGAGLVGGTLMQLLIPAIIVLNFWFKKEVPGTAFGVFWIGENLLNISVYIEDARKMELPLVGGGLHDWNMILSEVGLLEYDTLIAGIVRVIGWFIMISAMIWFVKMALKNRQ